MVMDKKNWIEKKRILVRMFLNIKEVYIYIFSDEEGVDGFLLYFYFWEGDIWKYVKKFRY